MSWQTFFSSFQAFAAKGTLRFSNTSGVGVKQSLLGLYGSNLRELAHAMRREPAFDRMALSVARHLPERGVWFLRTLLLGTNERAPATSTNAPVADQCMRSFFGEDRLVSSTRLKNYFPTYAPRYMHECRNELERYFRYRFCDDRFV